MERCHQIEREAGAGDAIITLTYDARFLRRKRLETDAGEEFLVDLSHTESLDEGDAFLLEGGTKVVVRAAPEALLEVTHDNMTRIAWHVGNRHTPCEIHADRLYIQQDPVLRDMLKQLGAAVKEVERPFTPEKGAYGHGRTHSHDHGHSHAHEHEHSHGHTHSHARSHDHSHETP